MKFGELILRGTHADRPAAADVPDGTLYYETDTFELFRSNHTAWQSFSSTGGTPPVLDCAKVTRNTDQLMTHNTAGNVNYLSADINNNGMWEGVTHPDRLTAQTAGRYLFGFAWQVDGTTGANWYATVKLNGTTALAQSAIATAYFPDGRGVPVIGLAELAVNDYLTSELYLSAAADRTVLYAANYSPVFWAQLLL